MIEEVIDTFRYNTPALEQQEFIRNSQIEASTFHTLSIKKMVFQSSLSKWGHSDAQCWGSIHGKKCEINKYLPQKYHLRKFISHGFYIKVYGDFEKFRVVPEKLIQKLYVSRNVTTSVAFYDKLAVIWLEKNQTRKRAIVSSRTLSIGKSKKKRSISALSVWFSFHIPKMDGKE